MPLWGPQTPVWVDLPVGGGGLSDGRLVDPGPLGPLQPSLPQRMAECPLGQVPGWSLPPIIQMRLQRPGVQPPCTYCSTFQLPRRALRALRLGQDVASQSSGPGVPPRVKGTIPTKSQGSRPRCRALPVTSAGLSRHPTGGTEKGVGSGLQPTWSPVFRGHLPVPQFPPMSKQGSREA